MAAPPPPNARFIGGEIRFGDKLVKGQPFSAETVVEDTRRLYDGSTVTKQNRGAVYRDTARYWELYQLAEKLVDLDDALLTWRHKHVLTVERIIGGKRGTGGSDGASYLKRTLERRCFPELWSVRTRL